MEPYKVFICRLKSAIYLCLEVSRGLQIYNKLKINCIRSLYGGTEGLSKKKKSISNIYLEIRAFYLKHKSV